MALPQLPTDVISFSYRIQSQTKNGLSCVRNLPKYTTNYKRLYRNHEILENSQRDVVIVLRIWFYFSSLFQTKFRLTLPKNIFSFGLFQSVSIFKLALYSVYLYFSNIFHTHFLQFSFISIDTSYKSFKTLQGLIANRISRELSKTLVYFQLFTLETINFVLMVNKSICDSVLNGASARGAKLCLVMLVLAELTSGTSGYDTTSPSKEVFLHLIAPNNTKYEHSLRQIAPAVELAMRQISHPVTGMLPGWRVVLKQTDSNCSSTTGPLAATETHERAGNSLSLSFRINITLCAFLALF